MRIRVKFLIVFFAISLFPLIFLTVINYNSARQALIRSTQDKLETIADLEIARIRELGANPSTLKMVTEDYKGLGATGEIILARRGDDGSIIYAAPRRFEKMTKNQAPLVNEAINGREDFFPESYVCSFEANHERNLESEFFSSINNTVCDDVTLHDPTEDVHKNCFNVFILKNDSECFLNCFFSSTAPYIKEVGRSTAVKF